MRFTGPALLGGAVAWPAPATHAQVTTITPTGGARDLGTTITPNGSTYEITGGTRSGGNLFHGFGLFSVGTGDIANFNNIAGLPTSNIIGRITGGQPSRIFGTIQTTNFLGTNLFLLNPAGWVFGPGASLNVSGSFHVSTADYLRFTDGGSTFCVNACPNGGADVLSVAHPAAFGFLGPTGPISIQESALAVPETATLSIVGGDVQIADSFLAAPGGRVQIGSFASEGEASVNGLEGPFASLGSIQASNVSATASGTATIDQNGSVVGFDGGAILMRGGTIDLSGVFVDVNGAPAFDADFNLVGGTANGSVVIRGGQIFATGSVMSAVSFANTSGPEVAIGLEATSDIVLSGTALQAVAAGTGGTGAIQIEATRLSMLEFASIDSITVGGASGADVAVDVGTMTLAGDSRIATQTAAPAAPAGPGGDITISASESVAISGFASGVVSVAASAEPTARGGAIRVSTPTLTFDGGSISSTSFGPAPGGAIELDVGDFSLAGGGQIFSSTFTVGRGGDIRLTATDSATITGAGSSILSVGSESELGFAPAGEISVTTRQLTVSDFGVIQSGGLIEVAGSIDITATEGVTISAGGKILSQTFAGDVGDVSISTQRLTMDNGLIQTSTIQTGNAGDILVNAGAVTMTHGSQIVASSAESSSGIGGNVKINANDLSISGRSPGEPVSPFSRDVRSGLFSTAEGLGPAGSIEVTANSITLSDGATIAATSSGTAEALAGNISIATSSLKMENSSITTQSLLADGGNITIVPTGSLLYMLDSQIVTSVQSGVGGGGNITIGSPLHPFEFIVLSDSGIHADAFGGPGGNVNILAGNLLADIPIESAITASSALSTPGIISIQANVTDISGEVSQLPSNIVQAATLLRAACTARLAAGRTSSLVVAGREGVPPEPDGLLSSPLPELNTILRSSLFEDDEQPDRFPPWYRVSLDSRCAR
jgi:filamentous hemagglutinin family protein